MKRFLTVLAALVAATIAFAIPAHAWNVASLEAEAACADGVKTVSYAVELTDAGPGEFTTKLDGDVIHTGSFGTVDAFGSEFTTTATGVHTLRVDVTWFTEESATLVIETDLGETCTIPTTTTTVPPNVTTTTTSSTAPPSTTTTPPTTTAVDPSPPTTVASVPPNADELASTGDSTVTIATLGTAAVLLGLATLSYVRARRLP